jgi:predicted site-specific integrase-resolvase
MMVSVNLKEWAGRAGVSYVTARRWFAPVVPRPKCRWAELSSN